MDNYGIKDMKNMIFPAWCWERSVRDYLLRVRVIVYGIGGRRGGDGGRKNCVVVELRRLRWDG